MPLEICFVLVLLLVLTDQFENQVFLTTISEVIDRIDV